MLTALGCLCIIAAGAAAVAAGSASGELNTWVCSATSHNSSSHLLGKYGVYYRSILSAKGRSSDGNWFCGGGGMTHIPKLHTRRRHMGPTSRYCITITTLLAILCSSRRRRVQVAPTSANLIKEIQESHLSALSPLYYSYQRRMHPSSSYYYRYHYLHVIVFLYFWLIWTEAIQSCLIRTRT